MNPYIYDVIKQLNINAVAIYWMPTPVVILRAVHAWGAVVRVNDRTNRTPVANMFVYTGPNMGGGGGGGGPVDLRPAPWPVSCTWQTKGC